MRPHGSAGPERHASGRLPARTGIAGRSTEQRTHGLATTDAMTSAGWGFVAAGAIYCLVRIADRLTAIRDTLTKMSTLLPDIDRKLTYIRDHLTGNAVEPTKAANGTLCYHEGETSKSCTRCWAPLKPEVEGSIDDPR